MVDIGNDHLHKTMFHVGEQVEEKWVFQFTTHIPSVNYIAAECSVVEKSLCQDHLSD